jgi:hypothetical protein
MTGNKNIILLPGTDAEGKRVEDRNNFLPDATQKERLISPYVGLDGKNENYKPGMRGFRVGALPGSCIW